MIDGLPTTVRFPQLSLKNANHYLAAMTDN